MIRFKPGVALVASLFLLGILSSAPSTEAKEVTFVIEMKDFVFDPTLLRVEPGDNVTIIVFNNETSGAPHTFDLDGYGIHLGTVTIPLDPGENGSASFTADRAGTFYFHCNIPGHATDAGGGRWTRMAGRLQVGPPPPPSDLTPIIVAGLLVLAVSLAVIVVYVLRGKKKKPS